MRQVPEGPGAIARAEADDFVLIGKPKGPDDNLSASATQAPADPFKIVGREPEKPERDEPAPSAEVPEQADGEQAIHPKPDLVVHRDDLPATASALRDLFAKTGGIFDRGMPIRLVEPADGRPPAAVPLTVNSVVVEAHRICRPVGHDKKGKLASVTLPDRVARMYLDMNGEWKLPRLAGVTTAPLLSDDGGIRTAIGYDVGTGIWCSGMPDITPMVPMAPMDQEAADALRRLRRTFRTFPFADADRLRDEVLGVDVVDNTKPPGADESAFLVGLQTAVCRPSLEFAPGMIVNAPAISGSGAGKGLLVRAACAIAFGVRPRAFTTGGGRQEFEKRLAAELIEAVPVVFIDNANGTILGSATLESAMTERPARTRILGKTQMVTLNSAAWIAATGNALAPSGDLARRFIISGLDPRCEDPEARPFKPGFLEDVQSLRAELLAAALIIWRWGRQKQSKLKRGRPLGGFETWASWCRDPLLTLGCRDPVERIAEAKARDPRRQHTLAIFEAWWNAHGTTPMKAADLADAVKRLIDPQERGRQFVAAEVTKLAGTRVAGLVLSRQKGAGRWSAATYALEKTEPEVTTEATDGVGHREHKGHRATDLAPGAPMIPVTPMPDEVEPRESDIPAGGEATI